MINSPDVNSAENTVGNISKKMNKIVTEGGWEIEINHVGIVAIKFISALLIY